MVEIINLCDNKYTLIYNTETSDFKALRYCEDWKDLTGDKMVYALFCEVQRLREKCGELKNDTIP